MKTPPSMKLSCCLDNNMSDSLDTPSQLKLKEDIVKKALKSLNWPNITETSGPTEN